jgi:hypothetical protein
MALDFHAATPLIFSSCAFFASDLMVSVKARFAAPAVLYEA